MDSWCIQTSQRPAAWSPSPGQTYWWRRCYWSPICQSVPPAEKRKERQKNQANTEKENIYISTLLSGYKNLLLFTPGAETLSIKCRASVKLNQSQGPNSSHLSALSYSTYLAAQPVTPQTFNCDPLVKHTLGSFMEMLQFSALLHVSQKFFMNILPDRNASALSFNLGCHLQSYHL